MVHTNGRKQDSVPKSVERTGDNAFVVKHDDGSMFEGKVDTAERFGGFRNLKGYGNVTSIGGFGEKKPLICDNCNKEVHKLTFASHKGLCRDCI